MNAHIVLPNLSYKINGALFKAHRKFGRFEKEKVYQNYLVGEINKLGLNCDREVRIETEVYGKKVISFIDLVVERFIALELKSSSQLFSSSYLDQIKSYLSAAKLPLGFLVNFHSLQIRPIRILNPDFKDMDLTEIDVKYNR